MIIQRGTTDLLLITQPDHAGLAAGLMARWELGGLPDHPRRAEILAATREHDHGWIEEDALTHVAPDGQPLDFITVPPDVKRRLWPRALERVARTDPYVAALVAQHALTVNAPARQEDGWPAFFDVMTRARDAKLARVPRVNVVDLEGDYPFVRIGDHLSLIFCNGWREPLSGAGYRAILKGATLEISPDPFGGATVPLSVPARSIPARRYRSAADLRQAFAAAPVRPLEGQAVGV